MIRRTFTRLTVASLAALTLVACQDREAPLAPSLRAGAPNLSLNPNEQLDQQNLVTNQTIAPNNSRLGQSFTAGKAGS